MEGEGGTESFNPEFPCDAAGKGSGVDTAVAQGRCCGKVWSLAPGISTSAAGAAKRIKTKTNKKRKLQPSKHAVGSPGNQYWSYGYLGAFQKSLLS